MKKNLYFKAGELCLSRYVLGKVPDYRHSAWLGPSIPGHWTISHNEINKNQSFLVLSDACQASHRYNRKIYLEVLTSAGPRLVWAGHFKMRIMHEQDHV